MNDVTQILSDLAQGNTNAAEQLLPLVYEELRKLAAARMAEEAPVGDGHFSPRLRLDFSRGCG
jgi:hypothetical protein